MEFVALGSPSCEVCPGCDGLRLVTIAYALLDTGLTPVAVLVGCQDCGETWRCALCPAVLALDGERAFRHMAELHPVL